MKAKGTHNIILTVTDLQGDQHTYLVYNINKAMELLEQQYPDVLEKHPVSRLILNQLKLGKYSHPITNYKVE